jgi:cytochrome c-type biogenesis protein CcmE
MTGTIATCVVLIVACSVALGVVLTLHFTRASRDRYWQSRAKQLADHFAEQQFRAAGLAESIALAKSRVLAERRIKSSKGAASASCSGYIEAEWIGRKG